MYIYIYIYINKHVSIYIYIYIYYTSDFCFIAERDGERLDLTAKEFALLHYFMTRAGIVMSQEHLLEHVWDEMTDPLTNVVRVTVSNLRKKLGDDSKRPSRIRTVRGVGYVLGEA